MRHLLSAIFLNCIVFSIRAQDTVTIYFDELGKPTNDYYKADYFQVKYADNKTVKTYHWGDSLDHKSLINPEDISEKQGRFLFCNNGIVIRDYNYNADLKEGTALIYFEDGKLFGREWYVQGFQDSIGTYYYKNGVVSSIEQYEQDSLIAFELFTEDGSKDIVTPYPEILAEFPGGNTAMKRYLANNIHYPQNALEYGIQGKCFLQFVIDINGKLSDVKVMRGVANCRECDEESIRVIKGMPDWKPGKSHNQFVNSTFNLPISFKLDNAEPLIKAPRQLEKLVGFKDGKKG